MASNNKHRQQRGTKISPLVNSLVQGDREGVGGFLCNDSAGLCLLSKGNMGCDNYESGVYTSLVRLASQLSPTAVASSSSSSSSEANPLVTIETETKSILIKEYDGNTVALTVPNTNNDTNSGGEGGGGEQQQVVE